MQYQNDSGLKHLMLSMNQAFENCSHKINSLEIERLSVVIYQVMSARYRIFHTVEHILTTAKCSDGVPVFAALFHDMVYYQVDKRLHPLISHHLAEFEIDDQKNECTLPDLHSERWLKIVGRIFGFKTGQKLNVFNGLNEFLSAVVAARMLNQHLSEWQTIQVIACIESTIPFRSQSDKTSGPFALINSRLNELKQELHLNINEQVLDQTIKNCIEVANQDICSFYAEDFGEFISGTWNLILENNPIFKNPLYTVLEYNKALQKIRSFFSILKFENVVHQWNGFPKDENFNKMKEQVSLNIKHANQYLDLKLIEVTLLEVLSVSSGGDAPYFLMIGQFLDEAGEAPIEKFFPKNEKLNHQKLNDVVYHVLKNGRKSETSFDFNHAPIAAFLYENLTSEEISLLIGISQELHQGKIDSIKFLKVFRPEVLNPIKKGISDVSWSRKL